MSMLKKDFVAIAVALNRRMVVARECGGQAQALLEACITHIAKDIADHSARSCEKFNRARFLAAAGVKEG